MSLLVPRRTEVPDTLEREVNRLGFVLAAPGGLVAPQPGQAEVDEWDGGSSLTRIVVTPKARPAQVGAAHTSPWHQLPPRMPGSGTTPGVLLGAAPMG